MDYLVRASIRDPSKKTLKRQHRLSSGQQWGGSGSVVHVKCLQTGRISRLMSTNPPLSKPKEAAEELMVYFQNK